MPEINSQTLDLHRATNRNTPEERAAAQRILERMGAVDLVEMVLGDE